MVPVVLAGTGSRWWSPCAEAATKSGESGRGLVAGIPGVCWSGGDCGLAGVAAVWTVSLSLVEWCPWRSAALR